MAPNYLEAAEELRPNPGQWAAYESTGDCVVLAGPGSGKTKTLSVKLARIIAEDVEAPRGVACITYSNECVAELRRRLNSLGIGQGNKTFIGTVHAFCLKRLVVPYARLADLGLPPNAQVATPSRQSVIFAAALDGIFGPGENPGKWKSRMDQFRRTSLDGEVPDGDDLVLSQITESYVEGLRAEGLVDFDDIVIFGLKLIEQFPWVRDCIRAAFPVVVVDEYQDLGGALHRMIVALKEAGVRIFVVGDPDQSIYGFSGAQPRLLEEMANRLDMQRVQLRFNYRSGRLLVDTAAGFIGGEEAAVAQRGYNGVIDSHYCQHGLLHQAEHICTVLIPDLQSRIDDLGLGDIAVLYPARTQGDVIAQAASEAGIEFVRFDKGAPFEKTPLTRWILECAKWCSSGWGKNNPRLNDILFIWKNFNRSIQNSKAEIQSRRDLVRFLFANRDPDTELVAWLSDLKLQLLDGLFSGESLIEDEIDAFSSLQSAADTHSSMRGMTVGAFSGQTGASKLLNLTTLHSSKGLEWKAVIMLGMDQGIIPWMNQNETRKSEFRRLFYVGLTRAELEVHLTYSGWTEDRYGRQYYNGPSEFLSEIQERLQEA